MTLQRSSNDLDIRPMTRGELDTAIEWAAAEGWNPGLADADPFRNADPAGFSRAALDGRMVACISAVRYGATYGFFGFYICHPDDRGRGFGWQTWQAGLAHLSGRVIGLDGVIAQVASYEKSGFVLAHRNLRFSGTVSCGPPADTRLRPIGADLVAAVVAYDTPFFPGPREAFLREWIAAGPTSRGPTRRGYALITDGRVTGYGVIRQCREGHKIGPLLADDEDAARLLFRALAATTSGATISLDPPEPNHRAIALAEEWGLTPVFETARMYRGPPPDLPLDRIFGITTFELG